MYFIADCNYVDTMFVTCVYLYLISNKINIDQKNVTCQDTLDNHVKGKDHIKRAQQMNERRWMQGFKVEEQDGFKTGPVEMAKLDPNEREELDNLRKQVRTLQEKVKSLQEARKTCVETHEQKDFKELQEYKDWCIRSHQRTREFSKPGIFCKSKV